MRTSMEIIKRKIETEQEIFKRSGEFEFDELTPIVSIKQLRLIICSTRRRTLEWVLYDDETEKQDGEGLADDKK